jgi:hypothetical protein
MMDTCLLHAIAIRDGEREASATNRSQVAR